VTGTTQMLDAFARHERIPERILLTSSRAVYGSATVYPGSARASSSSAGNGRSTAWSRCRSAPPPRSRSRSASTA